MELEVFFIDKWSCPPPPLPLPHLPGFHAHHSKMEQVLYIKSILFFEWLFNLERRLSDVIEKDIKYLFGPS